MLILPVSKGFLFHSPRMLKMFFLVCSNRQEAGTHWIDIKRGGGGFQPGGAKDWK